MMVDELDNKRGLGYGLVFVGLVVAGLGVAILLAEKAREYFSYALIGIGVLVAMVAGILLYTGHTHHLKAFTEHALDKMTDNDHAESIQHAYHAHGDTGALQEHKNGVDGVYWNDKVGNPLPAGVERGDMREVEEDTTRRLFTRQVR